MTSDQTPLPWLAKKARCAYALGLLRCILSAGHRGNHKFGWGQ
jgi:hypothetical protein